jgi:hypothetical protein
MVLALLPLIIFILSVWGTARNSEDPMSCFSTAYDVWTAYFGSFDSFFEPILTSFLTSFVPLTDSLGVLVFSWLLGYYISLLLVYVVFSLFTFLVTMFLDKIDSMKGGKV